MSVTASALLARFAAGLDPSSLPPEVVGAAKLHLLDTIGCGLAAYKDRGGLGASATKAMHELYGDGSCTVLGLGAGLPPPAAALVNGTFCHGLDFDNTHYEALVNVGAVLAPVVLAAAQKHGSDGAQALSSLVVGTEAVVRIGRAVAPAFGSTGFQPTAVCGVFGAALSSSRLLRLSEAATGHAVGLAASLAAGTYEPISAGSSAKPLQAGWSAQSGLTAATLASFGVSGASTAIEGRSGFLRSYFSLEPEGLMEELATLGHSWETPRVSFRAYPACTFLHGAMEAAQRIVADRPLVPERIREVRVSIASAGEGLVVWPRDLKARPRTSYDARFSLPYSIASILVRGRADSETYAASALADPRIADLAQRIRYEPREFGPSSFPGAVEIDLDDGRLTGEVLFHAGSSQRPMAAADVQAKFHANVDPVLGSQVAEELRDTILALETLPAVSRVLQLATAEGPGPAE